MGKAAFAVLSIVSLALPLLAVIAADVLPGVLKEGAQYPQYVQTCEIYSRWTSLAAGLIVLVTIPTVILSYSSYGFKQVRKRIILLLFTIVLGGYVFLKHLLGVGCAF